ncbi:hypothetical protein EDB83DRAFT_326173 [Lactarius deliciosus]|nr:hypothetical protein EDB83DRAFT_326173 [Lactarius deliciosus]
MVAVEHLAKIAAKNHKHTLSITRVRSSGRAQPPLRINIPLSSHYDYPLPLPAEQDGAVYCIVANEAFLRANKLETQAIEPIATKIGTDFADASAGRSAMDTIGHGMTRYLEDKVFTQAGTSRDDVRIVHCTTALDIQCCMIYELLHGMSCCVDMQFM